ncbi:hypothetical protein [Clostridioides difficile]|uniref:hypothetical protein n=1 Tax=Clostridioides difficile TaxID=1496 RepID=UPI000A6887E5|nr:hypothetical protein [Clostridioides difficile]
MRHYERTEDKKKRRGIYSEVDLLSREQGFGYTNEPDWWYTGQFDRSSEKNIIIDKNTSINKVASRVYKTYYSDHRIETVKDLEMKQIVNIIFINDPIINLTLNNANKGCTIDYSIMDNETTQKFIVTEKLNGTVIAIKPNSIGGSYKLTLTDEQILPLQVNSQNNITIEISTEQGGLVVSKTATFTRTNNKPTVLVNSYNSNSAKFIVSDLDNNLSKIQWYLDDVLKETITTDLTAEKTINYELTDNAIHTLKIVATDTENATIEKVLSISKEIMPPQKDASLSDISTKLVEIGEGFKNGKISIINVLGLKNIEAGLNNTLVELSEKIKTSFDSGDASLQDLTNKLTQANNTISQLNTQINGLNSKYKYAYSTDITESWMIDCGFKPDFVIYECQTTEGRLFVVLTPSIYACFNTSHSRWSIISSDYENSYAYSKNDINSYYGTKIRDNGFNSTAMPGDYLNDKYYFYYAIKCL